MVAGIASNRACAFGESSMLQSPKVVMLLRLVFSLLDVVDRTHVRCCAVSVQGTAR